MCYIFFYIKSKQVLQNGSVRNRLFLSILSMQNNQNMLNSPFNSKCFLHHDKHIDLTDVIIIKSFHVLSSLEYVTKIVTTVTKLEV